MENLEKIGGSKIELSLTQKGYTWSIQVMFDERDSQSASRSLNLAKKIDESLRQKYDDIAAVEMVERELRIDEQKESRIQKSAQRKNKNVPQE